MNSSCEFPKFNATSSEIKKILEENKVIAVVGLSAREERDSYHVAAYLKENGYKIIPVNPRYEEVLGEKCYRSLLEVPEGIDIVDVFRRPEAAPEIADQAIIIKAKVLWMQEGIVHNEAAEKARQAGMKVVMNKCILKEHARSRVTKLI